MKKTFLIFCISLTFCHIVLSQNAKLSVILGGDYWQTTMKSDQFFEQSKIGAFTSAYGYRVGVNYDLPIINKFTIATKLGYSKGGFDGFEHQFSVKINQGWVSISPQYQIGRLVKINAGGLLNINFLKKDNGIQNNVSPSNIGLVTGVSLMLNRFEFGCQYTHFFKSYFDYKKLLPNLTTGEKEYWNVIGVFIGYQILGKNPNNL